LKKSSDVILKGTITVILTPVAGTEEWAFLLPVTSHVVYWIPIMTVTLTFLV
jgi:hypothetical protein